MNKIIIALVAATVFCCAFTSIAGPVLKPKDRIIFIGDSITFQGCSHHPNSWVNLVRSSLKKSAPENQQDIIGLGGCGQTVGSWSNVEKKSRTKSLIWLPDKLDVGKELDKKADVLVVMLGMNDVLGPRVQDTEKSLAKWKETYREFIRNLKKRCEPRVFGLATPTPCTEAKDGPKNVVMDKLVEIMDKLAKEEDCIIVPTRVSAWKILEKERQSDPKAHITHDFVHPTRFGHIAIAAGMLRGLGEPKAAERLEQKMLPKAKKGISYSITDGADGSLTNECTYILKVFNAPGAVSLTLPDGWQSEKLEGGKNEFRILGKPNERVNVISIKAGELTQEVKIPAPWLVSVASLGRRGWTRLDFDSEKGRLPTDELVRTGKEFKTSMGSMEFKGQKFVWKKYTGGINYAGYGSPDYVDFAGVTYFNSGDTAYGMRWIHSDKEQNAVLKAGKSGFGTSNVECWFNGKTIFSANPMKMKERDFPVTLKKGWNLLSFKSNYIMHQWHVKLSIADEKGKELAGLKYAVLPE